MAGTERKYGERELDVLIVGGGGSAALAALEVKKTGLTVGLVTKESALVGGATIMAAGGTCGVFSPGDTPEYLPVRHLEIRRIPEQRKAC